MKTTHTPGPWKIHQHQIFSGSSKLADLSFRDDENANARLIASAPDLLSALEFLLADYIAIDGEELTGSAIPVEKARAALRKAKGE